MITRRNFMVTTAATASASIPATATTRGPEPLKAEPRVRTLYAKPSSDLMLVLFSDGPAAPRKLIKEEVLDQAFGPGTHLLLNQPDHWRMIDAGWFGDDELYEPTDPDDPAFDIWHAHYKPEVEAHDLLLDLFGERISSPFGGVVPELGLEFSEHPCTPRLALAKLEHQIYLPRLAADVSARTKWIVIDPELQKEVDPAVS